jgi:hypothetical protein
MVLVATRGLAGKAEGLGVANFIESGASRVLLYDLYPVVVGASHGSHTDNILTVRRKNLAPSKICICSC